MYGGRRAWRATQRPTVASTRRRAHDQVIRLNGNHMPGISLLTGTEYNRAAIVSLTLDVLWVLTVS
jgi:hypothetical protein